MKVLILVAHPDDAEISMGMKIQDHLAKGDEVYVHCISKWGYYGEAVKPIRIKECAAAAKILGIVNYSFSDVSDANFSGERVKVRDEIQRIMEKVKPDIYYTHYFDDLHLDHVITSQESLTMVKSVSTFIFFKSPYTRNFRPNLFFLGNKEMQKKKIKALNAFKTQKLTKLTEEMKLYSSIAYLDYVPHSYIHTLIKSKKYNEIFAEQFCIERMIETFNY